jgi:hypothetical protein
LQAASALRLALRPAWLSSFLQAAQPKLRHLDSRQLAGMATSVATLMSTASSADAAAAKVPARVTQSWVKHWTDCSHQQLVRIAGEAAQVAIEPQCRQGVAEDDTAEAVATSTASAAAAVGQLGVAAVLVNVIGQQAATPAAVECSGAGKIPAAAEPDRQAWAQAYITAAAALAEAVTAASKATAAAASDDEAEPGHPIVSCLDAAAASDIVYGLTQLQLYHPELVQLLQQQQQGVSSVPATLAAVAAAAAGSLQGARSAVLMRLVKGWLSVGAIPAPVWQLELAAALTRYVSRLNAADSLLVVEAFSTWLQHQPQEQQTSPGHVELVEQQTQQQVAALQRLLGALLTQTAVSAASYSPQQICFILSTMALQMGFRVVEPSQEAAVQQLLGELSQAHSLPEISSSQIIQLLGSLTTLGVAPEHSFLAAVQREGVKPRLSSLKPQEFADVAQALAGLRQQMDQEVLDGYWMLLDDQLPQLSGAQRLAP